MPTSEELKMLQALPLELKIERSKERIRDWVYYWGVDHVYVAFSGGKDSTVLLHLVRSIFGEEIPAVFINTGLEFPEIQRHVRSFPNVVILTPNMNFRDVLSTYGYPVIGKEVAHCIEATRNYVSRKLEGNRELHYNHLSPDYWSKARDDALNRKKGTSLVQVLFGVGLAEPKQNTKGIEVKSRFSGEKYTSLLNADFKISDMCCTVMKKDVSHDYQVKEKRHPFIGTLAEESSIRRASWLRNGCNVFDGDKASSKPLSFWTEQDILHYIKENEIKIADVYGEIVPMALDGQIRLDETYKLRCSGRDRTGCIYCPFGAHSESLQTEGRFVRLAKTHPKQYAYTMNGGAYDPEDGYWKPTKEGLGFSHVFDEMNRLLPTKTGRPFIRYRPEGDEMERARKLAEEKQ